MREWHLAILGGCLSHQASIPQSALYHRQLARWLEQEHTVRLRVHLARDFDQEPAERLQRLLQKVCDQMRDQPSDQASSQRIDAVLLHWRNTMARKVPLLVKRTTPAGVEYVLHPCLFRPWRRDWQQQERGGFPGAWRLWRRPRMRQLGSTEAGGSSSQMEAGPPVSTRLAGIPLHDLLLQAGRLTGLEAWAWKDECSSVQALHQLCIQRGLPLLVLGPSVCLCTPGLRRLSQRFDRRAADWLNRRGMPYASIPAVADAAGQSYYEADGVHLNSAGHGYVARRLEGVVERVFTSPKSSSTSG